MKYSKVHDMNCTAQAITMDSSRNIDHPIFNTNNLKNIPIVLLQIENAGPLLNIVQPSDGERKSYSIRDETLAQ